MKTSNNYIFDKPIPTARTKVEFKNKVTVAAIIKNNSHHIGRNDVAAMQQEPKRTVSKYHDDSLFKHLQWTASRHKQQRQQFKTAKDTKHQARQAKKDDPKVAANIYEHLEDDDLTSYGCYNQPRMIDSGSSGNYVNTKTKIRNRRRVNKGIAVGCTNGNIMHQIA